MKTPVYLFSFHNYNSEIIWRLVQKRSVELLRAQQRY